MDGSPHDVDLADALDLLALAASHVRQMVPRLSLLQLDALANCCPWEDDRLNSTLLDLDTWAIVAATQLRGLLRDACA